MAKSSQTDLANAIYSSSFESFVQRAFAELFPSEKFVVTWYVKALCYQLEESFYGRNQHFIATLPPRTGKSLIVSVFFPAWCLGHNPALVFLCISYSDDLCGRNARHFRQIVKSKWYKKLFPKMRISAAKDTSTETVTTMNGARYSTTLGGPITGQGAHFLVVDDPIKGSDVYHESERNRVFQTFVESASTRFNNPDTGIRIVTAQRLHEDDLIGRLIQGPLWNLLSIPAVAQEDTEYRTGPSEHETYLFQEGELMAPDRLSEPFLEQRRAEMTNSSFAAQFLQQPIAEGGDTIKREWFHWFVPTRHQDDYPIILQSWDTALKAGERNDYSACVTAGEFGGRLYVLNALHAKCEPYELQRLARRQAYDWNPNYILVEDANLGEALGRYLSEETNAVVNMVAPSGPKDVRIAQAGASIQAGKVLFPNVRESWMIDLERELVGFPNAKHDDLADAFAYLVNWWVLFRLQERPLNVRVTTIGCGSSEVVYQDHYYDRTGIPTF